jgi:hypothetical protein
MVKNYFIFINMQVIYCAAYADMKYYGRNANYFMWPYHLIVERLDTHSCFLLMAEKTKTQGRNFFWRDFFWKQIIMEGIQ